MSRGKKPLLADGSIVGDYDPLMKYFEIAKSENPKVAEDCIPRTEDFNYVRNYINVRGRTSLSSLLELLTMNVTERVNAEIAVKAFREVYGVELNPEDARERIARIIAGWIIEACRILGYVEY